MSSLADRLLQNQLQQAQNHYVLPKKPQNSPEYIHMYDRISEECQSAVEFSDSFNNLMNCSYQSKTNPDEKCNSRKDTSIEISGLTHDILQNPMAFRDESNYRFPFLGNWNTNSDFCGQGNMLDSHNGDDGSNFNKISCFDTSANRSIVDVNGKQENRVDILPEDGVNRSYSELSWTEYLDAPSTQKPDGWNQLLTKMKPNNLDPDTLFKPSDLEKTWRSRASSEVDEISPNMKRATPQSFDEKSRFLLQSQSQHWSNSAPLDSFDILNTGSGGCGEFTADANNQSGYADDSLSNMALGRPINSDQFTQFNAPQVCGFKQKPFVCKTRSNLPYTTNDDSPTDMNSHLNDEHFWLYKDPQGRIQGEFSDAQMNGWLLAGQYFTPSLRIRRKCDDTFSKLSDYINLFGRVPFTAGPRIPPFQGGISQDMVTKVRTLLAMQQAALFDAISANLPENLRQQISQSSLLTSLPAVNVPTQGDVEGRCSDEQNIGPTNSTSLKQPFGAPFSGMPCQLSSEDQQCQLQAFALAQLLCHSSLGSQASFEWHSKSPYTDIDLPNQQLSSLRDYTNSCTVPLTHFASPTAVHENTNKAWQSNTNPGNDTIKHEKATKSRSKGTRKNKGETSSPSITETRSESQSGRNSSNSSSAWARSSDSLLDSNSKSLHPVAVVTKSSFGLDAINSSSIPGTMAPKSGSSKKSRRKAGLRCDLNSEVVEARSSAVSPSASDLSKLDGTPKKAASLVEKNLPKNAKSQQPTENGVLSNSSSSKVVNSKKDKASPLTAKTSEELTSLVSWVQSAFDGIELNETVDIPTFVELLTTIDAPYEVESMLVAYIGNSKRSTQFVKEFLVRRHTCWQLHRRNVEEMAVLRNSSKKQPSQLLPTTVPTAVVAGDANLLIDSPPSAESPWQQIKVKNNSSRRSKKSKPQS